jgi:phosphoribosylglycinamide formyltransferase-1
MNIAVFASGNGTTLQSIIDSELNASIKLVVSNVCSAYALERARRANIEIYVIQSIQKDEIDTELCDVLAKYDIDLIVLAGYLKLIGDKLLSKYKIINTHPSLLPKFGGKGMYGMNVHRAVIESKEEYSGVTVHYVNGNYDEGNIIRQEKVRVMPNDTPEDLAARIQKVEKNQLIKVLKDFSKQQ